MSSRRSEAAFNPGDRVRDLGYDPDHLTMEEQLEILERSAPRGRGARRSMQTRQRRESP
jgi:hypothetical protein